MSRAPGIGITRWRRTAHQISVGSASRFFDRALAAMHAFYFHTTRLALPPHRGAFSIKLVLTGEERYFIDNRTIRLRPGEMLMVNSGQSYGSQIETSTRSLSIFYPERDATKIAAGPALDSADRTDGAGAMLDETPQAPFKPGPNTSNVVRRLVRHIRSGDTDSCSELAATLLFCAWQDLYTLAPPTALADIRKRATRDELITRILRARDYVEDMRGENSSLEALSEISCLSKYHFLRLFKEVVGETPARFARRRRLRAAVEAVAAGSSEDVVARRAGYANRHALRRALKCNGMRVPRS